MRTPFPAYSHAGGINESERIPSSRQEIFDGLQAAFDFRQCGLRISRPLFCGALPQLRMRHFTADAGGRQSRRVDQVSGAIQDLAVNRIVGFGMAVVESRIQTVEVIYRLVWTAIARKQPISVIYKDRPRLFSTHY